MADGKKVHGISNDLVGLATPIGGLVLLPGNPRRGNIPAVIASLEKFGQRKPITATADGTVTAGNHTLQAAQVLGWTHIAVVVEDDDPKTAKAWALADNRTSDLGSYDDDLLAALLADVAGDDALLLAAGYDTDFLADLLDTGDTPPAPSLVDRFVVPPFSVLDSRQGYWQDRRSQWEATGMDSSAGRPENLLKISPEILAKSGSAGTSIFDPVLCEIAYRWFTPHAGSRVLDPFAGGVVRGAVASALGHEYVGIDLSAAQVEANEAQAGLWEGRPAPEWIVGDAADVKDLATGKFDLLFSCPPYADLEVYSDDPSDLSTMDPAAFLEAHHDIIGEACGLLNDNRFAVWVISEIRDSSVKGGPCLGLVPATIKAFTDAGLHFYNEAVIVNSVGHVALRAPRIFSATRKLGRLHQNVIVAWKGDPKSVGEHFAEIEDVAWHGDDGA